MKSGVSAILDISAGRRNQAFQAILTQSGRKNFPERKMSLKRNGRNFPPAIFIPYLSRFLLFSFFDHHISVLSRLYKKQVSGFEKPVR